MPNATWQEIEAESFRLKPDLSPTEREDWVWREYDARQQAQDLREAAR